MYSKCAICVLTRGYNEINKYNILIKRNNCIDNQLTNKNIPIIIIHEGNISIEQQNHIRHASPNLNIIFNSIEFDKDREKVTIDNNARGFNMGYRHMCSFWFVDMFSFKIFEGYDYILRIDEDCEMKTSIENIFDQLIDSSVNYAICGNTDIDSSGVTRNMNKTTLSFLNNNSLKPKSPGGPMTQMIGFNMKLLRKEQLLQEYIIHVHNTKMIYINRWGDLSLWGEVFHYILPGTLKTDKNIKYYHGSHKKNVNGV